MCPREIKARESEKRRATQTRGRRQMLLVMRKMAEDKVVNTIILVVLIDEHILQ